MTNFLQQLLGSTTSPAQTAIPEKSVFSAVQERAARAHGFNSANEMMLWAQQRAQKGGSVSGGSPLSMADAMAWHPKNILEYVTRMIGGN